MPKLFSKRIRSLLPLAIAVMLLGACFASAPLSAVTTTPITTSSAIAPKSSAWLRLDGAAHHMQLNQTGGLLAFTDESGHQLSVLDLKSKLTYLVTRHYVGHGFFWGPDGWRLFYRELFRSKNGPTHSQIAAYDVAQHRSLKLDAYASVTGFPTFDPRELRMLLLTDNGIATKRLFMPDERLARWQIAQRYDNGKWLASERSILWLSDGGITMKKINAGDTAITSFDISPDGQAMAWTTADEEVFTSHSGGTAVKVGMGRDPKWHPQQNILAFSLARYVGNQVSGYDLAVVGDGGSVRMLTRTELTQERWPVWEPDGKALIYTAHNSTDLFRMEFTP